MWGSPRNFITLQYSSKLTWYWVGWAKVECDQWSNENSCHIHESEVDWNRDCVARLSLCCLPVCNTFQGHSIKSRAVPLLFNPSITRIFVKGETLGVGRAFIHYYLRTSSHGLWKVDGYISNNWFPWPLNMRICFLGPAERWFLIENSWLCTLATHTSMLIMWNLIRNYSQCQSLCEWRSNFTSSIGIISSFSINLWSTQINIGTPVSIEGICVKLNACGPDKKKCGCVKERNQNP